jgi:hypothetical protein
MGQIVQRGYRVTASRQSRRQARYQLYVDSTHMSNERRTFLVGKKLQACGLLKLPYVTLKIHIRHQKFYKLFNHFRFI